MNASYGKKQPYVIVVDDQKSYADRLISRLKWRGIPEDHIIWFEDASKAKIFITNVSENNVLGVVSDYLNGTISNTTGAEVILATQIFHPNAYTLLVSSEDRVHEPDVVAANFRESTFQRKYAHKPIAVEFLNPIQKSGRIELIKRSALEQFHEEVAIHQTLARDVRAIIADAFGNDFFKDLGDFTDTAAFLKSHLSDKSTSSIPLSSTPETSTTDSNMTKVKIALLRLWALTDEIATYGNEIETLLGKNPQASEELFGELRRYKFRFDADYKRFVAFCKEEMGYDRLTPLREHITHTRDADAASTIIHGINGVRDALGESIHGLADCIVKIKGQLTETKATSAAQQANGLLGCILRICGLAK